MLKIVELIIVSSLMVNSFIMTCENNSIPTNGEILYSPMYGMTTILMDTNGTTKHIWQSNYFPGEAVLWLGNGTIMRTIKTVPLANGAGGGVQKVEWDGTVVWDFRYDTNGCLSHHDIKMLPNGNVLMIAWEIKSYYDAVNAGRNPNTMLNDVWPDHVIEVKPTGPTSGEIVWEWHVWDHLIQDYDPSKENFGVVGDHPELVDVNFVPFIKDDWFHTNSIDYNEELDQILLSVRNFNEIWVIDHSTTTEEAADHTGGNSGKGGDLLYRWGNPMTYDAGTSEDQQFFQQHDATWVKPGFPGEGDILVFNNGVGRDYSSVDEIVPPLTENGTYYLEEGSSYGPETLIWSYMENPPDSFYANGLSGAERLQDGNTLICDGMEGRFFEVTPDNNIVWEYESGVSVFKIVYIPPPPAPTPKVDTIGSLSWSGVTPGETVYGSFKVKNVGSTNSLLNWRINSSINWGVWTFLPESGENLTTEDIVTVYVSVIAPSKESATFTGDIRVENTLNPNDFDVIPVTLKTPTLLFNNIHNNLLKSYCESYTFDEINLDSSRFSYLS